MAEEQIVSNYDVLLETLKLIVSGGIGAAIVVIVGKLVIDRRLEALKSQLEKKNVIHKLQFEKEFQLYSDLWKALVNVRRTASITPMLDIMPEGSQPLDVYKERWKKAAEALQNAMDSLNYNQPFYHNDVSAPAGELLSECRRHLIKLQTNLQYGERVELDMYGEDEKLSKMINDAVDKIAIAIQNRIGLLQEAQLIE